MQDFSKEEKLLLLEGSLSGYAIGEGLECLRKANIYEKGIYYQAFFSLSIGIERLLKLIIIYDYRENHIGEFPDNNYIKSKGHDLYEMFEIINPQILENRTYNAIIKFLSNFAQTTRYYNLDILTRREIQNLNPLEEWNNIEKIILEEYKPKFKEMHNKIELANLLNQSSFISYLDMNLNQINDTLALINESEIRDIIQGYDVFIFYKIISSLVRKLTDYEYRNNFFPYLREFYMCFLGNYTDLEIRRKKKWKNLK